MARNTRQVKNLGSATHVTHDVLSKEEPKVSKYQNMTEGQLERAGVANPGLVYDNFRARAAGLTYGKWKGLQIAKRGSVR